MRVRLRNDPAACREYEELTTRWVRTMLARASEQLPDDQVGEAVRDAFPGHIRRTTPDPEVFADEWELEFAVSLAQRAAEACIVEWERKNLGNRWGQLA